MSYNFNFLLKLERTHGFLTSFLIVVSTMVGTGIYFSTGSILAITQNGGMALVLWALGGFVALTGALCYAELSAMMPDCGGEYLYLKKTFGLLPAFLTGWISILVGFSASIAACALSLSEYFHNFLLQLLGPMSFPESLFAEKTAQKTAASAVIFFFGLFHMVNMKMGRAIQNSLAVLKIAVALLFTAFGIYFIEWSNLERIGLVSFPSGINLNSFSQLSLGLLIVSFAYSGWNSSAYIGGEIKNPDKNLPLSLIGGTVFTMLLYLLLNIIFLMSAPAEELAGQNTIAAIAAQHLFGPKVAASLTLGIVLVLLSSICVQLMVGPRICYSMAQDRVIFSALGVVSLRFHTPVFAVLLITAVSILYVLVGNPDLLMQYMGFALSIFPFITVLSLMILRHRYPTLKRPYKVPWYPLTPILHLLLSGLTMIASLISMAKSSLFAVSVLLLGIPVYFLWKRFLIRNKMPIN